MVLMMTSGGVSPSALVSVVYLWMNRSGAVRARQKNARMKTKRGKGICFHSFSSCGVFNFYSESRRPSDVCLGTISRSESPP